MRPNVLRKTKALEGYANLHRANVPISEVRNAIKEIVTPYISSPSLLDTERIYLLAGEASMVEYLCTLDHGQELFEYVLSVYKEAGAVDAQKCFATIAAFEPEIEVAKQKYLSLSLLEVDRDDLDTETLSHEVFRTVGALIEGSIQAYLRELLCLVRIRDRDFGVQECLALKLGNVVDQLLHRKVKSELLKPSPWEISLSQLRNVGQHLSLRVDGNHVVASYGTTVRHEVRFSRSELFDLFQATFIRQGVLKVGRTLFVHDNIDSISPHLPEGSAEGDSVLLDFSAMMMTQGFKVVDLVQEAEKIEVVAEDVRSEFEDPNIRYIHASQFLAHLAYMIPGKTLCMRYVDSFRGRTCMTFLEAEDAGIVAGSKEPLIELVNRVKFGPVTTRTSN